MNAHLRYWKGVVQAAEAELDAATTNSELKLAARRLLRAREYLNMLATKRTDRRPQNTSSGSKVIHRRTIASTPPSGEIGAREGAGRARRKNG